MLNKVTLSRLVMFNRKRGGEVEMMKVSDYNSRKATSTPLKEIESVLSPVERMLCARFGRVEIRGKKGRTVPVLLLPVVQKSIDLLLKYRREAGVHEKSIFLFARPNYDSLNPIRMCDTLRYFLSNLNLTAEELLTSTRLRKHVATVSQILNLSNDDLEVLADFMGHDIEVHMSFYRLPQNTIQVAKMGKLPTAFNNGTISKYSGKSLDEISLDEELSSDEEAEDDEVMDSSSASGATDVTVSTGRSSASGATDVTVSTGCSSALGATDVTVSTGPALVMHSNERKRSALEIESHMSSKMPALEAANECKEFGTEGRCPGPSSASPEAERKSSKGPKQARKVQRLTQEQSQLLRKLFEVNITMRRELKMIDCINTIKSQKCLNSLKWIKIKNTIHNWITTEKRKLKH
ncbi:uncharacterized protein LOC128228411 [Mya arenaria]|uniref:uncharacterized protein LOC128228411 n=1 Tax=Mya arenaria TaxID=6604 RepID=UPI0022E239F7|nr:uncharacterized protein LOC128228411 [Mya arenaria]